MTDSIREQVLEAIKARLEEMEDPDYDFEFSRVQREPFKGPAKGKKYVAAIFDDRSRREERTYPLVDVTMEVNFEFLVYVSSGDNPSSKLNNLLANVEKALMTDRTFGGLAIDISIIRDEHDIEGRWDKCAETTLFTEVKYRHNSKDPSSAI